MLIAESLPQNEGILLANDLCQRGVDTRTVADQDIEAAVAQVDSVLVGGDAVTRDHLLNKVGTRRAVMKAREMGIPAYAIVQTFKTVPPEWPLFLERQAPADVDPEAVEEKGAPIFELTPLDAFAAVFSEEGLLTRERLTEIRSELGSVELMPAIDLVRP